MNPVRVILLATLAWPLLPIAQAADPAVTPAPAVADAATDARLVPMPLELAVLSGDRIRPFDNPTLRFAILVFLSNDCPICQRYAPELRRLDRDYSPRGVALWLVHALPGDAPDDIRRHASAFDLPPGLARDPGQRLLRATGVRVTPEAVLVDRQGQILYRGRIDDRFPELGRQRAQPTRHDLRDAVEAALAGKSIAVPRTRAVGCVLGPGAPAGPGN